MLLTQIVCARKAAGMTQAVLAKSLGKHQSYVSKIENGERRLDVVEFLEIAAKIGLNPLEILNEKIADSVSEKK